MRKEGRKGGWEEERERREGEGDGVRKRRTEGREVRRELSILAGLRDKIGTIRPSTSPKVE